MECIVEHKGVLAVVQCSGSLDASTVAQFKEMIYPVVQAGAHRVILDAQRLLFIDSVGLGMLISLARKLREKGGEVKIASPSADVRSIFDITRLTRLFDLCESTDDAKKRFANG